MKTNTLLLPGDESSIVRFREIRLDRYPLRWGQTIEMNAEVEILEEVADGIRSVASIGPLPFTRDLEIPCMANNFGSCNTDLCGLIERDAMICNFLKSTGNPCTCPLKPGVYRTTKLPVPMPVLPPLLQLFANVSNFPFLSGLIWPFVVFCVLLWPSVETILGQVVLDGSGHEFRPRMLICGSCFHDSLTVFSRKKVSSSDSDCPAETNGTRKG